jgi:drug/metabolite transporter (DMT)-like permease
MVRGSVSPRTLDHLVRGSVSLRTLAHLAMCFTVVTFSLWNVLGELLLSDRTDPVCLAFIRECGTALALVTIVGLQHRARRAALKRPTGREAALFLACGAGGVFGLQLFYILGLSTTSANEGAMFQPVTPVLVMVLSAAFGLERLKFFGPSCESALVRQSWQKLGGVLLAAGGCALVVLATPASDDASGEGQATEYIGSALLFASDMGAATFILSQKPLLRSYEPSIVIAVAYAIGAACMVVTALAWKAADAAAWRVSTAEAAVCLYLVAVCGVGNYTLMTWANQHLDATIVAIYGVLQPPVTALIAFVLLGEQVAPLSALGGVAVIAGMCGVCTAEQCHGTAAPAIATNAAEAAEECVAVLGCAGGRGRRGVDDADGLADHLLPAG